MQPMAPAITTSQARQSRAGVCPSGRVARGPDRGDRDRGHGHQHQHREPARRHRHAGVTAVSASRLHPRHVHPGHVVVLGHRGAAAPDGDTAGNSITAIRGRRRRAAACAPDAVARQQVTGAPRAASPNAAA